MVHMGKHLSSFSGHHVVVASASGRRSRTTTAGSFRFNQVGEMISIKWPSSELMTKQTFSITCHSLTASTSRFYSNRGFLQYSHFRHWHFLISTESAQNEFLSCFIEHQFMNGHGQTAAKQRMFIDAKHERPINNQQSIAAQQSEMNNAKKQYDWQND